MKFIQSAVSAEASTATESNTMPMTTAFRLVLFILFSLSKIIFRLTSLLKTNVCGRTLRGCLLHPNEGMGRPSSRYCRCRTGAVFIRLRRRQRRHHELGRKQFPLLVLPKAVCPEIEYRNRIIESECCILWHECKNRTYSNY